MVELRCPHCNSEDLIKNGRRLRNKTVYQEYKCRNCGKYPAIPIRDAVYQGTLPQSTTKKVLLISDLHCGHRSGLTPPAYNIQDEFYESRADAWKWYIDTLTEIGTVDVLIVNGDAIDGFGKRSGGTELIAKDIHEQCIIAKECIDEIPKLKTYMVAGTGYHTGDSLDYEEFIADSTGATFHDNLFLKVSNTVINARHKVGSSSVPYGRVTAALKESVTNVLQSESGKEPRADIVVRSHVHYYVNAQVTGMPHAIITPALQLSGSKYGLRQCTGNVDFGMVLLEIDNDGSYVVKPYIAKIEDKEEMLVNV